MIAGTYLEHIIWNYDPSRPAACELWESYGDKETFSVALRDGTADAIVMLILYMSAMRDIRREDENYTSTPPWLLTIMCSIYREPNPKRFTSLDKKHKVIKKTTPAHSETMVVWTILADVLTDIYDSLILDFCTSLTWTGIGLESLRRSLFEPEVDISPLLEFSFGQVMPLLLLLVFALTALEVGSITKPIHKEAQMPGALAARGFGEEETSQTIVVPRAKGSSAVLGSEKSEVEIPAIQMGDTTAGSTPQGSSMIVRFRPHQQISPQTPQDRRGSLPLAARKMGLGPMQRFETASSSSSSAGRTVAPISKVATPHQLETRVNTLTTEEGNPASTPRYQSVVEAAREKRKVAFCIALLVSVIHFVGVLLFTYFCFPYSAFAFAGFLLLSYVWKTVRHVIFIRRFRVAYLKLEAREGH
ncbi:uncharacterized protein VDAG_03249 [Verticillium dahliae VdLs.17]|uniref:Uncharacterized protein n=1 Tax=Verticillium dahliae (strain VdLs.17 / ATCC MYA-4575 / FGSC 10137) TaxID=498257 RepID=G2WZ07_VERDV|nr:uncharacterized protein VDAG_03249 [Verticillium dahliae VdLs.17]EGY21809.1 hypothetical protein VDAG_03249 [Verticillium dahliae VdLs.17]